MSEKEYKKIFSKNLDYYMVLNGMVNADLAKLLGVSESSVAAWRRGDTAARMKYVDHICEIFGITRSALMDTREGSNSAKFINEETQMIAEEIYRNKDMRMLFNAAINASAEDLKTTYQMLKILKDKEGNRE